MKALLIGDMPPRDLGHDYVNMPPYDGVVIGSLTISQLLYFCNDEVLEALCPLAEPMTDQLLLELLEHNHNT